MIEYNHTIDQVKMSKRILICSLQPTYCRMRLKPLQTLSGHEGRVWSCSWNPKGTLLATCGEDTHVRLWGEEGDHLALKTILSEGHTRTVRGLGWSPCGNCLAAASFDGTVSVWDKKGGNGELECNATLEGHENEVKGVAWLVVLDDQLTNFGSDHKFTLQVEFWAVFVDVQQG